MERILTRAIHLRGTNSSSKLANRARDSIFARVMTRFIAMLAVLSLDMSHVNALETLNKCGAICGRVPEPIPKEMPISLRSTHEKGLKFETRPFSRFRRTNASSSSEIPRTNQSVPVTKLKLRKLSNSQDRIVNGYSPEQRPWLALIIVMDGSCGGALLNKRFDIFFLETLPSSLFLIWEK